MTYQVKCKAIALAAEAREFKKQEQRELRLYRLAERDNLHKEGNEKAADAVDRHFRTYVPQKGEEDFGGAMAAAMASDREAIRVARWKAKAAAGRVKARRSLDVYHGIRDHRFMMIRTEARSTYLALGFLRGKAYHWIENFAWTQPNWDRVRKIAIRYAGLPEQEVAQKFAQWQDEALNGVEAKYSQTLVPGSVRDDSFDPEWVKMQMNRA